MAVKGVFASDQNIQSVRKGDFASGLLQTMPQGSAPMFALTAGMDSADASDTVVTWFEENRITGRVSVVNNASTGTTFTVSAADATTIVAGQIYLVESTGEYVFVDSISGTSVTVTRGFGGTSVSALDGSSTAKAIQKIGTAHEEGSSKPTSIANIGFPRFNYMQIFRNAWDVTGTARAVEYLTGDVVAKNQRDCAMWHAEDIERSLLWGVQTIGVQNGKPFRTMLGILNQITTNVVAETSTTKKSELDAFLLSVFQRNIKGKPNERIAFCGNTVVQVLQRLAELNSTVNIQPGQTEFGLKVMKWMTPFGDISLLTHPLMNESPLWTKDLYVLHPGAIRTRYLRRTRMDNYDTNGSRAGADADYGVMTTEMSVEYRAEITGGKFTNITGAVAES